MKLRKMFFLTTFVVFSLYTDIVKADGWQSNGDDTYVWFGSACNSPDGKCPAKFTTTNNPDGTQLNTRIFYLQDGSTVDHEEVGTDKEETVTYYENGKKTFERVSKEGENGSPQYQGTYFDSTGKEIGKESYTTVLGHDDSGNPNSMIMKDIFYGANNNILKSSVQKMAYTDNGEMNMTQEDLVYSDDGNSFGRFWNIDPISGDIKESLIYHQYDSEGNITETIKAFFEKSDLNSTEGEFIEITGEVYDAKGNKIKDAQIITDKNLSNITVNTGFIDEEDFVKDSEKVYNMGTSLSFILTDEMILNIVNRTLPEYNKTISSKVYDIGGHKTADSGDIIHRRIYTVEEATEAISPKGNRNTFIIKYR